MKKLLLYTLLPIVASILNLSKATSQVTSIPVLNRAYITPESPTPTDSVTITFNYVSGDSCPDYYLVKDSVVANNIYVSKKSIDNSRLMCAQVVTKFTTTLNLGLLKDNSQIYFEGALIKIISYSQVIPPVQNNVYITPENPASTDSVTVAYIYVSGDSCPDYYLVKDSVVANSIYVSKKNIIPNPRVVCAQIVTKFTTTLNLGLLKDNTQIYFDGALIKTISYSCIMDKNGVIVAGTGGCTGHLFIQEKTIASPAVPRLYSLPTTSVMNANGTQQVLIPGDNVKFGGYELLTDSYANNPCPVYGIATCYEVVVSPPAGCVKDKKGIVVTGEGACAGQLFIQEYSPINSARQLYTFNRGDSVNSSGTVTTILKAGDQVLFGGYPTINITGVTNLCQTVGVATCYEVITTPPACVMNNVGTVIEFKDNSSIIKADTTSDIYAIRSVTLPIGTRIQFKGEKIECITTPCYNIVDCYQVIGTPPCVMDKKGIVVAGIDGCTGRIFIQDTSSPNPYTQLYAVGDSIKADGTIQGGLKPGDIVEFAVNLIKNDSNKTILCPIAGVVTCYNVISTPPACVMNNVGTVVEFKDNSSILKADSTSDIYAIKDVTLPIGTRIQFKGEKIECITTPCYNIVDCYQVIGTPPCVMDKNGVIVAGTGGCTGHLFIEERTIASPAVPRLYSLPTTPVMNANGTQQVLIPGDNVKFGGYELLTDSYANNPCPVFGIATCYEVIVPPPTNCVKDKKGIVVTGEGACAGQLFIQEYSPINSARQLYTFNREDTINSSGTVSTILKAGDQVLFGGYLTSDSTLTNPCHTVGVATCYQLVQPEIADTLMGTVYAGNAVAKTGLAILYRKGDSKAAATYTMTNGSFVFTNLPKAAYTVYIIPDINAYKYYLPTFYKNNFLFQNADYITLTDTTMNVTVNLKSYVYPVGTGKIYGNIFFETYTLKDSLLVDSVQYKTRSMIVNNSAINTPVLLINRNNEPVAWTQTDVYGNYTFENIALDTYKILSETASAEGDSYINLTPDNSIVNTDLMLKGLQSYTGITNPEDLVLSLYPNPASDKLIIILKEAGNIGIYNVMGQMLLNKTLTQGINVLDLSTMNKDIYFAKIGGTTIKLIKK